MKVSELMYNWHQNGSTAESQGAGEDYGFYKVGRNGVKEIIENDYGNGLFDYLVTQEMADKTIQKYRVSNANHVTYL